MTSSPGGAQQLTATEQRGKREFSCIIGLIIMFLEHYFVVFLCIDTIVVILIQALKLQKFQD